ncbi:MAG: serine/threonine-protein kinase [Vicinamibacterales bacterium]
MREPIPALWPLLSPLLDRALELAPEARRSLIAEVRVAEPVLADTLDRLLAEHDRALGSAFLEGDAASVEPAPTVAGRTIAGYTLVRPLGMGGMGTVWLASRSDGRFEGDVALKLLNLAVLDDVTRERFRREGTLLARLSHPHIARLFDAGITELGQPYLVLEHVAGVRIDAYASAARLDIPGRLELFLQVADAVAHAHANLVVHRDVKPCNVLVDANGQAKLLDFGIAALVDDGAGAAPSTLTLAAGPALTPAHAAPEQAAGHVVTTAADVYALGVLLFQLLVGRHPTVAGGAASPAAFLRALAEEEPARASDLASALRPNDAGDQRLLAERRTTRERLRRACRGDLDTICAKALQKIPADRYASVTALADDVRRHLRHEPIAARPDSVAYRGWTFARRHRLGVTAAIVMLVALVAGLLVVNRERRSAERRFDQVRALANRVLALDNEIRLLPGSTTARHELATVARDYLEALLPDAAQDETLALEVGTAYFNLAGAQGVPGAPNLGMSAEAAGSLQRADELLEFVLSRTPDHPEALSRSALVAEARMKMSDGARQDVEALGHARHAADRLEAWLATGGTDDEDRLLAARVFGNIALFHKNVERYAESVAYARRGLALVSHGDRADEIRAQIMSMVADDLRLTGDLDHALETIVEARRAMARVRGEGVNHLQARFNILWRQGVILGEDGRVSLGRTDDAIAVLQRAYDLADDWAATDTANAASRILVGTAARELGSLLRHRDASRAVAVYDHALSRLAEVEDSPRARSGEVELLADSSRPLRASVMWRARRRVDEASAVAAQLQSPEVGCSGLGRRRAEAGAPTLEMPRSARRGHLDLQGYRERMAERTDPERALTDACGISRVVRGPGPLVPSCGRCAGSVRARDEATTVVASLGGPVAGQRVRPRETGGPTGLNRAACQGLFSVSCSTARALAQSRWTVRSDTWRIRAISPSVRPQKNFRSTSSASAASHAASSSSACARCSRFTSARRRLVARCGPAGW